MPISDKERSQKFQEKYQAVLSGLLKEDDNKYCADCDAKGPRWASWNLGIFVCIRCAGIHRNLGVHISRVKSVNLDQWTAEQIASMQAMGNAKSRSIYEQNLPDTFRRSQTDSAMEQFIRNKYENKKWIAKEWTQPPITVSSDLQIDDSKDRRKVKTNVVNLDSTFNSMKLDSSSSRVKKSSPKQSTKVPEPVVKKNEASLLDLENTTDVFATTNPAPQSENQLDLFNLGPVIDSSNSNDTTGNNSLFSSDFYVTPSTNPSTVDVLDKGSASNQPEKASLNNSKPSENNDFQDLIMGTSNTTTNNVSSTAAPATGNKNLDKNSIMALFGQTNKMPTTNNFNQPSAVNNNNMFPANNNVNLNTPNLMNNNGMFNSSMTTPTNGNNTFGAMNSVPQSTNNNLNFMNSTTNNQNFQMQQMNIFGQNPYGAPVNNSTSSNSMDLFGLSNSSSFTNTGSNQFNSNQSTLPNIGNTLSTDLWQ